jgi:hypothetical protein
MVKKKAVILYKIIEEGIASGEFRRIDPVLATVSVMGAINFYISINYTPFDHFDFLPEASRPSDWNGSDFLGLILHGLKPCPDPEEQTSNE